MCRSRPTISFPSAGGCSDRALKRGRLATNAPAVEVPSERELDIRYYADLLWRGRWIVLVTALVAVALGLLVGYMQTPIYRATAMLMIEPPTPTFMSVTDALVGGGGYWQNNDFYNTQFTIM